MQIRIAKSLGGGFEGNPKDIWGCEDYTDRTKPVVFCGMYDLRDYIALWRHKSKAFVFWCGGDIGNLSTGFVFNNGKLRWLSAISAGLLEWWIYKVLKKAEHWVENEAEAWQLKNLPGRKVIECSICPSFFGDINNFPIKFRQGNNVWLSANEGRQQEYGWGVVEFLAVKCPQIRFHLYGAIWKTKQRNIIVHGKVPLKQMNRETSQMQCGLRLNKFDGFSEVLAKSILWGQYPISYLYYPCIQQYTLENNGDPTISRSVKNLINLLNDLPYKKTPNINGRNYYLGVLNKFPWNCSYSKTINSI